MIHRWLSIEYKNIFEKVILYTHLALYSYFISMQYILHKKWNIFFAVMPMIIERRAEVENLQYDLQGRCYDLEYTLGWYLFSSIQLIDLHETKHFFHLHFSAIKSIDKSEDSFKNIHELLKSAIFLKHQLKGEETRRRPNTASNQNSSVYKRLSGIFLNNCWSQI